MAAIDPLTTSFDMSLITSFQRRDFLDALFGKYFQQRRGFIEVQVVSPLGHKPHTRFFPNIDSLAKEHFPEEKEVSFGICPREGMRPGRGNVHYITALWAAFDIGGGGYSGKGAFHDCQKAARAVRNFPLVPSVIVESGRGAHLYWLFDQPLKVSDAAAIEKALKRIGIYFKCKRESRIDTMLRLPGTFNNRVPELRRTCKIKYINSGFRYKPEDVDRCLGTLRRWGIHLAE